MSALYNGITKRVNVETSSPTDAECPPEENLTQPLVVEKNESQRTKYTDLPTGQNGPALRQRDKNLGNRLTLRKRLMKRRRWLVNVEFVMALTGLLLMMVENELYYANAEEKSSAVSFVIKLFTSLTTVVLLVAICLYYQAGIELRMFDGRVDDPFAVTPISTWFTLAVELGVCAIHPYPGNTEAEFVMVDGSSSYVSIDGILSVLMMLRLYLVGKFIVVNSQLLTDRSTHSVAAVSHVKVNINFVFKAALNKHPAEVITAIIVGMYVVSVWSMRTCELYYSGMSEDISVSESMWLSAITFLTVGYGDLTPKTQCGRFIAVTTAMMGLCSTALLVAVIARKLEQTHKERYVHNFLLRVHLRNKFKAAASDVIKHALKLWQLRRRGGAVGVSGVERTVVGWRLTSAIRTMRASRAAQAEVEEASVGLSEVCQLLTTLDKGQRQSRTAQATIMSRLDSLSSQIQALREERGGQGGGGGGQQPR